jgi:hypothetical protein
MYCPLYHSALNKRSQALIGKRMGVFVGGCGMVLGKNGFSDFAIL